MARRNITAEERQGTPSSAVWAGYKPFQDLAIRPCASPVLFWFVQFSAAVTVLSRALVDRPGDTMVMRPIPQESEVNPSRRLCRPRILVALFSVWRVRGVVRARVGERDELEVVSVFEYLLLV